MIEQIILNGGGYELFIRLVVAALLGLLIGTERSLAHKVAGMRTFSLISLSASLFIIIAQAVNSLTPGASLPSIAIMAGAVISGIGFIGTGLIFFKHENGNKRSNSTPIRPVNGLTTAAGLWVTAGVGMACGLGYYVLATLSTVLAIIILGVVTLLEEKIVESK